MIPDSDAVSVTSTCSFFSAVTDHKEHVVEEHVVAVDDDDAAMNAFCLDIEKLEKVVSNTNGGVACLIRRPESFEKPTYFLFQAVFVDGTKWDAIIPHPNPFRVCPASTERSFYHHGLAAVDKPPQLIGWRASSNNDAGVAYFIVDSTKGYEHWLYIDWLCFACAMRVSELEREQALLKTRSESVSSTSSTSSIVKSSQRTTEETDRTEITGIMEVSKVTKTSKSVRFGADEVFKHPDICQETETMDTTPDTWKVSVSRKFKLVARYIRSAGRKLERPLITLLMRIGF